MSVNDVTLLIPIHKDGRKDWLKDTLSSFARFAPGIQYVICENEGDVTGSMNEGLEQVKTEYVLPFGSDDLALPEFVQKLRAKVATADVAYPSMALVSEDVSETFGYHVADPYCPFRLDRMNYITGASLVRTESLRRVGGWRHVQIEDWDLWRRMRDAGMRFRPCEDAVFMYRQRSEGRRNVLSSGTVGEVMGDFTPEPLRATFYAQATEATTYWRCQVPGRALPGMVRRRCTLDPESDRLLEHEGAAIWQFPGDQERAAAVTWMTSRGIRTLVEVDDNYLDRTDHVVRGRTNWSLKIGESAHSVQGHEYCVKTADGVVVTTEFLADIYRRVNPNVFICPNSIDPSDWTRPRPRPDGIFRIGWFASLSHDRDEPLVRKALSWASRQPGVQVLTMGVPVPWTFRRTQLPWADDIRTYFRAMQSLDVGICAVTPNLWSNGRSDLKALEYGMSGALPVVSSVPPYDTLRGTAAQFCANEKQWMSTIQHLVRHQDEARELAQEFQRYVMAERTIEKNIWQWEEAING